MAAKSVKAYAHIRGALGEEGPARGWLKSQGSIQAFYGKEAGFEGLCVTVTAQGAGFGAGNAPPVVLYTTKPPLVIATGGNGLRSFGGTTIIPEAMAQAINGLVMGNIIKEGETIYRPAATAAKGEAGPSPWGYQEGRTVLTAPGGADLEKAPRPPTPACRALSRAQPAGPKWGLTPCNPLSPPALALRLQHQREVPPSIRTRRHLFERILSGVVLFYVERLLLGANDDVGGCIANNVECDNSHAGQVVHGQHQRIADEA